MLPNKHRYFMSVYVTKIELMIEDVASHLVNKRFLFPLKKRVHSSFKLFKIFQIHIRKKLSMFL